MLRFVYNNIKLYNVRERRVHLTEASPIGCVQNVHCIYERFEVIMYNQVSRCFKTTGCDHSLCTIHIYSLVLYSGSRNNQKFNDDIFVFFFIVLINLERENVSVMSLFC